MKIFAWVRARGASLRPAQPVIIHDKTIGPKLEFVGDLHLMKPHQDHLTIDELAECYPAPEVKPEP